MLEHWENAPSVYTLVNANASRPDAWSARSVALNEHHALFFVCCEVFRYIDVALWPVALSTDPQLLESKVISHGLSYPSLDNITKLIILLLTHLWNRLVWHSLEMDLQIFSCDFITFVR